MAVTKEKIKKQTAKSKKEVSKVIKSAIKAVEKKVETNKVSNEMPKRTMTGTVVSTKMQKTVVVAIERKVAHKLYGKLIKVTKKIKADTNGMEIKEGDTVKIQLTRPMSKDKNYKVISKD
jgi:small subunit ribosomal protein S17